MATEKFSGPVNYLVFAFNKNTNPESGLKHVLERVDQGIIELLDIEVVSRNAEGNVVKVLLSDLGLSNGTDLSVFDGVDSGILDDTDLNQIASSLETEQAGICVVYEDRSLAQAASAWSAVGGNELFAGGVDLADLEQVISEGK